MRDENNRLRFILEDEAATVRLAHGLQSLIDTPLLISLEGDLGVGKSAFARAFIQAACGARTIVPSPSFTLMQEYESDGLDIVHADLYRLTSPEEVYELGLLEALDSQICLVEWASNGAGVMPPADITLTLNMHAPADNQNVDHARQVGIQTNDDALLTAIEKMLGREAEITAFLAPTRWACARRLPLAGDASTRRYERLHHPDGTAAVLMDWQAGQDGPQIYDGQSYSQVAHLAEAAPAYCRMNQWLENHDLVVPQLIAADEELGFVLMQDLGDRTLAVTARDPDTRDAQLPIFYAEAIATLLHLHAQPAADFLAPYDGAVQAVETSLFLDWYLPWRGISVSDAARAQWMALWQELGDGLMAGQTVTVLRDFHSVNLLWQDDRQARYRLGLIDVQDALAGHPAYDVVSLLQDARLDVSPTQVARSYDGYVQARFNSAEGKDAFAAAYAVAGVQRNLKIAGIFIRLDQRDGKPSYLAHLPRILGYVRDHMAHPALAGLAGWMQTHAPDALNDRDEAGDAS